MPHKYRNQLAPYIIGNFVDYKIADSICGAKYASFLGYGKLSFKDDIFKNIFQICDRNQLKCPNVYILQSDAPVISFKNHNCLIISKRLIEILTTDELMAIIGCQLGHASKKDPLVNIGLNAAYSGAKFFWTKPFRKPSQALLDEQMVKVNSFIKEGREGFSCLSQEEEKATAKDLANAKLLNGWLGEKFISLLFGRIFLNQIMQFQEYRADALSVKFVGKPEALCRALEKISMDYKDYYTRIEKFISMSLIDESWLANFIIGNFIWNQSPRTKDRIARIKAMQQKQKAEAVGA